MKKNVGFRAKLVPPACHLDPNGELLATPVQDEDWIITAAKNDHIEIKTESGLSYSLGYDNIRNFATDADRSKDGLKHCFLLLLVQIYVCGNDVSAVPNHRPGAPVPPQANPALKARATLVPELAQAFRRQVYVLDRVLVNYSTTANELVGRSQIVRPNDTWESLKPAQPRLFPNATVYRDLSTSDAELLAEFYGAVSDVADLIESFARAEALTNYNAWNVLMHKVENSLRLGDLAIETFCPDRVFDPASPAGGTLLSQSQRVLAAAAKSRDKFMADFQTQPNRASPHTTSKSFSSATRIRNKLHTPYRGA